MHATEQALTSCFTTAISEPDNAVQDHILLLYCCKPHFGTSMQRLFRLLWLTLFRTNLRKPHLTECESLFKIHSHLDTSYLISITQQTVKRVYDVMEKTFKLQMLNFYQIFF